jgi:DNA end-binding protein Ku
MAAPARPYWTGYLKLSLVTIGVRLYTATSERDRVRFNQIHGPSGERVRQQLVVPGLGPVERDDIVKGYEYEKGRYVTVDPEDLKRMRLETTDTIDIVEFVDAVEPIYFDSPYYLVPDGKVAEEGYRVIREALAQSGKIAVGQVVINGQERIIAIRPLGMGLLGNALRYEDEIRKPEDFFGAIAADGADEDQLAIMDQIIARKTKKFDAGKFVDHYQTALRELNATLEPFRARWSAVLASMPEPERERVHAVIYEELCLGQILPASRAAYRAIIGHLIDAGAEGIILGCTEIGLLIGEQDSAVPLFDTTRLHAAAAVAYALAGLEANVPDLG